MFGGPLGRDRCALKISSYAQVPFGESDCFDDTYDFPQEHQTFFTETSRFSLSDYEVFLLKWSKTNDPGEEGGCTF